MNDVTPREVEALTVRSNQMVFSIPSEEEGVDEVLYVDSVDNVSSQKAGATGAVCQDAPSMRIAARGAMRLARLGNWHAPETRS